MPHSEHVSPRAAPQRLFLALWPDDDVRARLASVSRGLSYEGGRGIAAQNLHLTLAFLGDTDAARRACIEQALSAVTAGAFELVLGNVRYRRRGGTVWLEAADVPARLRDLVASLEGALVSCRHACERRAFRAHVTLARNVRRLGRGPSIAPVVWKPAAFCLVSSTPAADGSVYSVVGRWPLA